MEKNPHIILSVLFSGSVSLSGEEYVLAVTAFIKSLELDLTGSQALRLSYSITSISTTLTEEQVVHHSPLCLLSPFLGDESD